MVVLRRRALFLFVACLVLLFGGIWTYQGRQENALQAMGESVDVVVAARDLQPWAALTAQDLRIRQVLRACTGPERIAVPNSGDKEPDNGAGIASDC